MDPDEVSLKTKILEILPHLNFDEKNRASTQTEKFACEGLARIQQVLLEMKCILEKYNNLDETLAAFPDLCQFLGRLNQISVLALHPNLSNLLMECILKLYTERPTTPFEKKTQKWVLFHIRNSICLPREQKVLFEHVGKTSNLTYQKALCMLKQHVMDFKNETTTVNCYPIPCESKTPENLDDICRMLIFLLHNQDQYFSSLVDAFMDLLSIHSNLETVQNLFKKITDLQQDIYTDESLICSDVTLGINKVCLSNKSLVKLWTSYLPSLENEVLSLVTQTVKRWNRSSIPMLKSLLEYRYLPQSCAFNYQLFYTTTDLFHSLVHLDVNPHRGGRQAVLEVISLFYNSVHEHLTKSSKTEESFLLTSLYPPFLSNFINHVQTVILSQGSLSPVCVKNLSSCVRAFYEEDCDGQQCLEKIWVYCQHFSSKLLPYFYEQLFILPSSHISECLFLLLWFQQPQFATNQQILSILMEFLSKLKTLFKTSNGLGVLNLEELLPNTANMENGLVLKPLAHCLLLTCIISSNENLELMDQFLELVSDCKDLESQSMFFLSVQKFLPLYQPKTKQNYVRIISLCAAKLQIEISNNTNSDGLIECLLASRDVINVYS